MVQSLKIVEPLTYYSTQQVFALMLWPGNEARQQVVLATLYKALLVKIEQSETDLGSGPEIQRELDDWRKAIGGWPAIVDAPPMKGVDEQIRSRRLQASIAGSIFLLLYNWSKEPIGKADDPSKNKVMHILEADAMHHGEEGYTQAQMRGAWQRFRSVAHLWGALEFVLTWRASGREWSPFMPYDSDHGIPALRGQCSIDEWRRVLLIAAYFYKCGTEYKVEHGQEPILDPRDTVAIEVPKEWKLNVPETHFPPRLLKYLKTYRAPK